ncbi:MAG TPA: DUF4037 domain-containing protein [Sedimentibacter sp.]|nr:DUF4037 domain-containing protein [Tissierellia bacterium]HOW23750.1 DUF4037 domain-containing protein [Sedimentibacter sp.]HRC79867.1 DUF4037 domain-containing protein [Sedimentibacter sp.]
MVYDTNKIIDILISNVSQISEVQSIGISGGKNPIPKTGEGDIDIFIYCDRIPVLEKRQAIINGLGNRIQESRFNVFEGGHWGTGDFLLINGVETWLMYFTVSETLADIESILNGQYPDKIDNYYYPTGRCAMLKNIKILWDKSNFLNNLKKRLSLYPDKLRKTLIKYHLEELEDTEDLQRAKARKDVLFYHFALDIAIDHFLQALFALNETYFPSRKRTLDFIEGFTIKPEGCSEKLLEIIKSGSSSEGISRSVTMLNDMVEELKILCVNHKCIELKI